MKTHKCYGCGKRVETFLKVKRRVYFVKIWQCIPACLSMVIHDYYVDDMLRPSETTNDLLKYAKNSEIPKGRSDVIRWKRLDS